MVLTDISYSVPEKWYENLYRDKAPVCSAARSFSMVHSKADECWLLIHGYCGYPGEMVRPAIDLYQKGFDVYVPRLPGHGTSGDDFVASTGDDWVGFCTAALKDLQTKYRKVHLLGHSMGAAIASLIGCPDPDVGKIVLVSPSFENKEMSLFVRLCLAAVAPFRSRIRNTGYHPSDKYHLHYENAPCDNEYLGKEYWRYYFPKKLGEYYLILKEGLKAMGDYPHEHLFIYPERDHRASEPSAKLYRKLVGNRENIVMVKNGGHFVLYDKNTDAEDAAVAEIIRFAVK